MVTEMGPVTSSGSVRGPVANSRTSGRDSSGAYGGVQRCRSARVRWSAPPCTTITRVMAFGASGVKRCGAGRISLREEVLAEIVGSGSAGSKRADSSAAAAGGSALSRPSAVR